jgi:plastocyanin
VWVGALAVCLLLLAGCGDEPADQGAKPGQQVVRLTVVTEPGAIYFDKDEVTVKAGRVAFELVNGKRKGHNIRIQTGRECCFRPGSQDLGGTPTIGTGRARFAVDLKPGTYWFLCSAGGHWHTQRGKLIVR